MNKIIFFDAGPVISLVMSRLIWILPKLKQKYGGKFYITPAVQKELVERPLTIKRFEFEALQVLQLIENKTFEIYDKVPQQNVNNLIKLANNSFSIQGKYMDIIQAGEMESVVCALETRAQAVVMDERTLRLLMENSSEMVSLLKSRFQQEVVANQQNIRLFKEQTAGVDIIRSLELIAVSYKMGLLNEYIPKQKGGRELLLDSVLWAVKMNGCAATSQEIEDMKKILK